MCNISKSFYDYSFEELISEFVNKINEKAVFFHKIVLTTRRCFCLICCVKNNSNILSDEAWNKIVSSQSIEILGDELSNKKILLVDDIMIHGRAVFSLYEKLSNFNPDIIDTFVLARNIEYPDFYSIVTKKDYENMFLLTNREWKKLSNQIIDYFTGYTQLYISYIYFLDNIQIDLSECQVNKSGEFSEILNNFSTKNDIDTEFYYFNCSGKLTKFNCLRKYTWEKNNITKYVPYFELKDFTADSLVKSWNVFLNKIDIPENKKEKLYRFSSINIYKSYSVIINLFLFNLESVSCYEIDKSYFDGFLSIIKDIILILKRKFDGSLEQLEEFIIECGLQEYNHQEYKSVNSIYSEKLCTMSKENNRLIEFSKYISLISSCEDKQFCDMMKNFSDPCYLIGEYSEFQKYIPSSVIYEYFNDCDEQKTLSSNREQTETEKIKQKNIFYSFVIALLDRGIISHSVQELIDKNGIKFVGTIMKTGEQSYKIPFALDPSAFLVAANFYDLFLMYKQKKDDLYDNLCNYKNYLELRFKDEKNVKIINNMVEIITNIIHNEFFDLLDSYSVLKRKDLLTEIEPILNSTVDYFLEADNRVQN